LNHHDNIKSLSNFGPLRWNILNYDNCRLLAENFPVPNRCDNIRLKHLRLRLSIVIFIVTLPSDQLNHITMHCSNQTRSSDLVLPSHDQDYIFYYFLYAILLLFDMYLWSNDQCIQIRTKLSSPPPKGYGIKATFDMIHVFPSGATNLIFNNKYSLLLFWTHFPISTTLLSEVYQPCRQHGEASIPHTLTRAPSPEARI